MDQLSSVTHRLKDKHFSVNKITAEFSCLTNSICNEIKRSTVFLYNVNVQLITRQSI